MRAWIPTLLFLGATLFTLGLVPNRTSVVAGTALRLSIEDLARDAGLIVEGRVIERAVQVGPDGLIETELELAVERTLKGDHLAHRTVRFPGGLLPGGEGLLLSGMPSYAVGEEVLLFLSGEGARGLRMPVGLAQGKFRVVVLDSARKVLVQGLGGVDLVDPSGRVERGGSRSLHEYAEVLGSVHAALAAAPAADAPR